MFIIWTSSVFVPQESRWAQPMQTKWRTRNDLIPSMKIRSGGIIAAGGLSRMIERWQTTKHHLNMVYLWYGACILHGKSLRGETPLGVWNWWGCSDMTLWGLIDASCPEDAQGRREPKYKIEIPGCGIAADKKHAWGSSGVLVTLICVDSSWRIKKHGAFSGMLTPGTPSWVMAKVTIRTLQCPSPGAPTFNVLMPIRHESTSNQWKMHELSFAECHIQIGDPSSSQMFFLARSTRSKTSSQEKI